MKKILRFSDKLVISLAFLGDAAIGVYANSYLWRKNDLFDFLSGRENTLRGSVNRLLRTGEMEKIVKNGEVCYCLTSAGEERIQRIFPLFQLADKGWDKKWRIAVFDIPEKEKKTRELLRRKLVSLGFGELQKSVYISPLDVLKDLKEMLENYGLYGKVIVFEAREIFSNQKEVGRLVWKLDQLEENYRELLERMESLKYSKEEKLKEVEEIKNDFFNLILKDPFLPKELLPDNWSGERVRMLARKTLRT